jgi:hypothetical protein
MAPKSWISLVRNDVNERRVSSADRWKVMDDGLAVRHNEIAPTSVQAGE